MSIGDIRAKGGPVQHGGAIEIKTGMQLQDTPTGADGPVTMDRTLEAGYYDFEYVNSSDPNHTVTLTVTGDTVIHCQYRFAAHIVAAEGLAPCPVVEVYAGPPIIPVDDVDPVPFSFRMHPRIGPDHAIDVDLTCGGCSPGGGFVFDTAAFGSIDARHLDASAGFLNPFAQDLSCLSTADPTGGQIILLARRGDIAVRSLNVSGDGSVVPGNGGCVMMRGDNVSVYEGIAANGAGIGSQGGQVYIEVSDYITGEEGQLRCSGSSETPAISARGGGMAIPGVGVYMPGAGGDVTLIPLALTSEAIDVSGVPVGTINEWFPDLTGILDYE